MCCCDVRCLYEVDIFAQSYFVVICISEVHYITQLNISIKEPHDECLKTIMNRFFHHNSARSAVYTMLPSVRDVD